MFLPNIDKSNVVAVCLCELVQPGVHWLPSDFVIYVSKHNGNRNIALHQSFPGIGDMILCMR